MTVDISQRISILAHFILLTCLLDGINLFSVCPSPQPRFHWNPAKVLELVKDANNVSFAAAPNLAQIKLSSVLERVSTFLSNQLWSTFLPRIFPLRTALVYINIPIGSRPALSPQP